MISNMPLALEITKITMGEKGKSESGSVLSNSLRPHGLYSPQNSPGQNTGVGRCSLLQGIFPMQRLDPGHLQCRQILYLLGHKGSPRILEWDLQGKVTTNGYRCIIFQKGVYITFLKTLTSIEGMFSS